MVYKINIIKDDRLITSYKSPIIPKHYEKLTLHQGEFEVKRLGYIIYSRDGENLLSELDIHVV